MNEEARILFHLVQSTDLGTDNLETGLFEKKRLYFDPTNETFPKKFSFSARLYLYTIIQE